ncbi:MAG: peptidoglycan editing factor PgeF [Endomicrobium sp.]|jgi:YfiH family protein|nr:peptidoglycan editing factor PgeF [Endomicrobium sp.]
MNFIFSVNFPYKHFTTTKSAGDMKNKVERDSLFRSIGLNPENLVLANQVHGSAIKIVKRCDKNTFIDNCDGLITDDKNLLLGIFTADCIPILVSCNNDEVKAVVHVGWKGLYLGIVESVIGILINGFCISSKSLKVYIGPHIRSCCYKTGIEMEDKFNVKLANGKLNLSAIVRAKLESCGVNKIFDVNQCTCHNEQLFFSYRRDCCTDRLLSVI